MMTSGRGLTDWGHNHDSAWLFLDNRQYLFYIIMAAAPNPIELEIAPILPQPSAGDFPSAATNRLNDLDFSDTTVIHFFASMMREVDRLVEGHNTNLPHAGAFHSPVFKTAMNASCGISTLPMLLMRFLPFFCFSSSLRLRVMSPP